LSPAVGAWIAETFGVTCVMMRDSGMQHAEDDKAFFAARDSADAILTKDHDFVLLVDRHGSPPSILWLTCGNTSNEALRHLLGVRLADAIRLVQEGEKLVEIG